MFIGLLLEKKEEGKFEVHHIASGTRYEVVRNVENVRRRWRVRLDGVGAAVFAHRKFRRALRWIKNHHNPPVE